jgi:hypothetical protein
MNRRHWLGSLFTALLGAWAAGRTRPASRPTTPPTAPPWRPTPSDAGYPCGTYTYCSSAAPLSWNSACTPHSTVTTYSYSGGPGEPGGA